MQRSTVDDEPGHTDTAGPRDAADLREAVGSYVAAVHDAYLEAGGGTDGTGLAAGPFTVVAAAARSLHVLATREELEVPEGGAADPAETGPLTWRLTFLDPSVAPALGEVPGGPDEAAGVQDVLGVDEVLYHLVVGQGSTLTGHHAMHTGTGIAHREQQP